MKLKLPHWKMDKERSGFFALIITPYSLLIFLLLALCSCVEVKEYQKMYINDSEMQLSLRKTEIPEMHFMLYREGAAGANGGKTGGGCGCN